MALSALAEIQEQLGRFLALCLHFYNRLIDIDLWAFGKKRKNHREYTGKCSRIKFWLFPKF